MGRSADGISMTSQAPLLPLKVAVLHCNVPGENLLCLTVNMSILDINGWIGFYLSVCFGYSCYHQEIGDMRERHSLYVIILGRFCYWMNQLLDWIPFQGSECGASSRSAKQTT